MRTLYDVALLSIIVCGMCISVGCYRCPFDGVEANCSSRNLEELPTFHEELESATALNLNDNHLEVLSKHAFGKFRRLRHITVARNRLAFVDARVFSSTEMLNHSPVTRIDFSDNHLHAIPNCFHRIDKASTKLHNVVYLNLAKNEIGPNLEKYSLEAVRHLETLDLSWNNIMILEQGALRAMEKLLMVDLSYNRIANVPPSIFHRRSALRTLRLAKNRLCTIPPDLPPTTEILDLSFNRITYLSTISSRNLRILRNLRTLNISNNWLEDIDAKAFSSMSELRVMDLSKNQLYTLPSNVFSGTKLVEQIYLNGNFLLEFLPDDIFVNLKNLRYLFLHDCSLKTLAIGPPAISPVSFTFMLRPVTSSNAEVSALHAPQLEALWLFGNPINCDCKLLPLIWFIRRREILLDANTEDLAARGNQKELAIGLAGVKNRKTICATPTNRRKAVVNTQILEVSENHLMCPEQYYYIIFACILGLGPFLLSIPSVFFMSLIFLRCQKLLGRYGGLCGISISDDEGQ